jgi:methylenetetrahydrofolate reductase (NADPH)
LSQIESKTFPELALSTPGRFASSLRDKRIFSVTWELAPGRGAFERAQEAVLATAEQAAKGGKVHALTISDNAGGNPALSAEMLGVEIARLGIEPLVHLTCKDKNRSQMESLLYGLERANVRNLLTLTGDYPKPGYNGVPMPVFDLDSTTLLGLIAELNQGMEVPTPKGTTRLTPTHFFPGASASPFKSLESEQMGQYYKLKKKLAAGAQFVVSQLGYDARKFQELLYVVKLLGFEHIPVVGNIFLLPLGAARLMNSNGLPGCVVSDKLLAEIQRESSAPDKGKGKRLERAAKMYAILSGLGFAGAHISGHGMTYDDLEHILCRGEDLVPNWMDLLGEFDYPQPNGWYFFEKDAKTGLNREAPVDRSKDRPRATIGYKIFRALHRVIYDQRSILFKPLQVLSAAVSGSSIEPAFTRLEQIAKQLTNDCRHCGDCSLAELAYLCPASQCVKNQRNGPCGGSCDGWCEKYPNQRKCVYVLAYERLKSHNAEESLGAFQVPPVNYDLFEKSSWINYFLGRDHSAKLLGISPPPCKTKPQPKNQPRKPRESTPVPAVLYSALVNADSRDANRRQNLPVVLNQPPDF